MTAAEQQSSTPLEQSPHPLVFVAATGREQAAGTAFRSEVMGLGGFQKEGLVEDLATGRTWRLACDEGTYLGGADRAPAPLTHWGGGLHADLTSRVARTTLERGLPLRALAVTVTQGFGAKGSFVRGEAKAQLYDLACWVTLDTDADDATVNEVVAAAIDSSAAFGVMRNAVPGVFALYTNGRRTQLDAVPESTEPAAVDPLRRHDSRPTPVEPSAGAGELNTRRMVDSTWSLKLSDDSDQLVQWHLHASGHFDVETGLVHTEVGLPGGGSASAWTLISDDTNRRAPHPLAYFSIGTAFCYHTQLCRYAAVRKLAVEAPRLTQTTRFDLSGPTASADLLDTQLFIRGGVEADQSSSLLTAAANICYAHRAWKIPVQPAVTV